MVYAAQFGIILTASLLGELLYRVIPLPIPASIYGLLLMLLALCTGLVKLHWVEGAATLLLEWLPLLLVPATVGLMTQWDILGSLLVPLLLVCVVSTMAVMGVSGLVTQWIMRHREGRQ